MSSILSNNLESSVRNNLKQVELSLESTISNLNHVSQQLALKEYFVKNDMIEVSQPFFTTETPATLPAQMQQKISGIGKIIKKYSWKMIYAKDEMEYNKLREEMIAKAKGLGYDEVVQYEVDLATKTVFPNR